MNEWVYGVNHVLLTVLLTKLWRLPREGNGMRCTKGSTANTVMNERVILTEFDSSSHTYMRICVINETIPATRENTQCHMTHIQERLAP